MDRDFVSIGRLGAPKGVRGDLKVHSYSGESAHFRELKEVALRPYAASSETAGAGKERELRLEVLRVEGEGPSLTMAFKGYPSPEAARALTGLDIVVPRAKAAPLNPGEWYEDDLVGLTLVSGGKRLAEVASILEGGAEPWLEALLTEGRKAIVPFRNAYIGQIDIAAGTIELLAPELLDE